MSISTYTWWSTLEGLAFGLGIASGIRTLLRPEVSHWLRVTIALWASSYLFLYGARSFLANRVKFAYYALHVVVYLYRNLLLYFFGARITAGYALYRFSELPMLCLYSIFHIGWIIAGISSITGTCLIGTWPDRCEMSSTHQFFRIGTDASFVLMILLLDSSFVYHLARKLCRQHGLGILTFHTNVYHACVQLVLCMVIGLNIFRLCMQPRNDDAPIVYPIWEIQDVVVLLLLIEFGCKYNLVLAASRPDTAQQDLEAAHVLLSRAENTKNNILRYLHHELRNNLQRMMYLSDHLIQTRTQAVASTSATGKEEEESNTMRSIQTCSAYMVSIVEDVLTIEDYESGTLTLHPRTYNLSDLIRSELAYLLQFAQARGRRFRAENTLPASYVVRGDPDRVRQVLRSLGESCIKRSEEHLTLIDCDAHVLAFAKVNGSLIVEMTTAVTDIFDAKWCEPYVLHPGEGPHDLGLSVVHRILRAVHGHIVLDSTRQRARIVIPVELDLTDAQRIEITTHDKRKLKVLIVDDSRINRTVLRKLLKTILGDKVSIQEAEDGQAATTLVLQEGHVFDVIWMDMVMPIKDGIAACREIKAVLPTTVIIMVSANDMAGSDMQGPVAPDDAILKPVKKPTLEGLLRRHKLL